MVIGTDLEIRARIMDGEFSGFFSKETSEKRHVMTIQDSNSHSGAQFESQAHPFGNGLYPAGVARGGVGLKPCSTSPHLCGVAPRWAAYASQSPFQVTSLQRDTVVT